MAAAVNAEPYDRCDIVALLLDDEPKIVLMLNDSGGT